MSAQAIDAGLVSPLAGLGAVPAVSTPGGCDGTGRWSEILPVTCSVHACGRSHYQGRADAPAPPEPAQGRHGQSKTTG